MNYSKLPELAGQLYGNALENDLSVTTNSLDSWIRYREEHVDFQRNLESIGQELRYKMMVPITSKAFMKGSMVHTNELLVNLGDNWFVKRSAAQTRDICHRRIQLATEKIESYEKQYKLITDRFQFPNMDANNGDLIDIKEPYDEEAEKKWREQHKINVKREREQERSKS